MRVWRQRVLPPLLPLLPEPVPPVEGDEAWGCCGVPDVLPELVPDVLPELPAAPVVPLVPLWLPDADGVWVLPAAPLVPD
jgi:hypothetical protein